MKTIILNKQSGREVQENQWVTRKDYKGLYSRFEILELHEESEEARVRYLTGDDGYLYTTQSFFKLGLRKVLL